HNVGSCYRCHTTVEPRVSKQWFVKMKPLAGPAIEAVRRGETEFIPERFSKLYYHWMENIRDWCISRQLWWGHRIPAYYCDGCGEIVVSREAPQCCPKCGCEHLTQDPDTLDTWFSSALWPFSTLGWPDKTPDLEYFYPTDVLVTAYDIIFFWVARMIFSGIEQMGEVPFKKVFIHGIIRDEQGRKMSKSLGNGIDPIEVIDKFGADALRFTLATGVTPGNDMRFLWEKVESSRNFCNKIWNAARFILMNTDGHDVPLTLPERLEAEDKWIVSSFNTLCREVTENIDRFEFGVAVQKLNDFIWDEYCDWYIEFAKSRLNATEETADGARRVLVWVMTGALRLLHPFMPFITEEIWQSLPHEGTTIMLAAWPEYDKALCFPNEADDMRRIMEAIRAIRNRRAEMNVPPSKKTHIFIETAFAETFAHGSAFFERLAYASAVLTGEHFDVPESVQIVTDSARIYIPLGELVDFEKELARLNKERDACERQLEGVQQKLRNEGFLAKAPASVVEAEREKAAKLREKLVLVGQSIDSFKK
ncbi:MAG: valine--tRNA ligase, partial [Clostridia bacterium]|nr:valine--tRNA ligase [Clostridia bacterium]